MSFLDSVIVEKHIIRKDMLKIKGTLQLLIRFTKDHKKIVGNSQIIEIFVVVT